MFVVWGSSVVEITSVVVGSLVVVVLPVVVCSSSVVIVLSNETLVEGCDVAVFVTVELGLAETNRLEVGIVSDTVAELSEVAAAVAELVDMLDTKFWVLVAIVDVNVGTRASHRRISIKFRVHIVNSLTGSRENDWVVARDAKITDHDNVGSAATETSPTV